MSEEKVEWITLEKCPVCDSTDFAFSEYGFNPVLHFPEFFGGVPLALMTSYWKCHKCGVIFQNPRLSEDDLQDFYASGAYRQMINPSSPTSDKDNEDAGQIEHAELVPDNVKHMDIGCSHGLMLQMTKMRGCEVLGVEPNQAIVNFGVPSVKSIYEATGEWDVITCFHVLEHVPDLHPFVDKLIELVKPGGTLYLEVPGEGTNGYILRMPHLYNFNSEVIRRLFSRLTVDKFEMNPHCFFKFHKEAT